MSHADDGTLNALLDGELDADRARVVEAHLAGCGECRRRFEEARSFLVRTGELLNLLAPELPVAAAGAAPASALAAAAPAAEAPRRVSRTEKEKAIEIDGSTQKSPAVRLFPQGSERVKTGVARTVQEPAIPVEPAGGGLAATAPLPAIPTGPAYPPARAPIFTVERLAWAASIALALAVGFLSNEVRVARREVALLSARVDTAGGSEEVARAASEAGRETAARSPATGAGAARVPAARGSAGADGGAGALATSRSPVSRPVSTKPAAVRVGTKPASSDEAARAALRGAASPSGRRAAQTARADTTAGAAAPRAGELSGLVAAAPAAAPAPAPGAAPSAGAGAAGAPESPVTRRQAPLDSPRQARDRAEAPAPALAAPAAPSAPVGAGPATAPATFRRISFDDAIGRLSGSIRLIDGIDPVRVEVGPGRLVPGSDPARDVIRVVYTDLRGQRLTLDQQPGDAGAPLLSINGMMRGDTLVTATAEGWIRIRWVDRKGFWLSLSGNLPVDSMRALVTQVR